MSNTPVKWTSAGLTPAGNALQAELLNTGDGITFTRAAAADADGTERLALTLQSPRTVEGPRCRVPVLLSNIGVTEAFTMTELRFYVKRVADGTPTGDEVLYATATDETGDAIPTASSAPGFTIDWAFVFQFGNASDVTVTLDPAGLVSWGQVGAANGVAPLDEDGKVPDENLPEMDYIPLSQKGAPNGVAELDENGKVPSDSLSALGGSLLTIIFDEALEGLPYTLAGGEESYAGTVPESLTAVHSLLAVDTDYTLTVTDAAAEKTYTRTVHTDDWYTALDVAIAPFAATITVTCPAGSSVTCVNGSTTLSQTATSGTAVFTVGNAGTWTVTATLDGESASGEVVISADGESKSITLQYTQVYGVMWNMSNQSTALTRLTPENDPNHYVAETISTEPVPAVGTGSGSSPFDAILPWSGMYECNVNASGTETAKKGESGFSRSISDVMIWIPAFWYKIVQSGTSMYYYIADKAVSGFEKHPGSGKYIGRYTACIAAGVQWQSRNDAAPAVNFTRSAARSGITAKGANWHQYDIATYSAIVLLYAVEFADWDSQSKIGKGNTSTSAAINNGGTDAMTYHTGRAAGTDGQVAVQYRGIENLWGNVYQWVDGFNANGYTTYVCTDPARYADDTSSNYTATGITLPSSGWIKGLGLSSAMPWAIIPDENGGSETTYVPDYINSSSSGWHVLCVGGSWNFGSSAGLLCFNASNTSSSSSASLGARLLCKKPA